MCQYKGSYACVISMTSRISSGILPVKSPGEGGGGAVKYVEWDLSWYHKKSNLEIQSKEVL